jgi:hypothetical protein
MWIRKEGAFDGIVPVATFMAAQEILAERSKKLTDAELLDHLKALYAECGRLSGFIIDQAPALPSAATYIQRFGSLTRAYELVGYHYPRSTEFLEINRRLRQLHPEIVSRTEHTWIVLSAESRVLSQVSPSRLRWTVARRPPITFDSSSVCACSWSNSASPMWPMSAAT